MHSHEPFVLEHRTRGRRRVGVESVDDANQDAVEKARTLINRVQVDSVENPGVDHIRIPYFVPFAVANAADKTKTMSK